MVIASTSIRAASSYYYAIAIAQQPAQGGAESVRGLASRASLAVRRRRWWADTPSNTCTQMMSCGSNRRVPVKSSIFTLHTESHLTGAAGGARRATQRPAVPGGASECRVLAVAAVLERWSLTFWFVCPAPAGPRSGLQGNVHLPLKENFEPKPAEADMTAAVAGTEDAFSVGGKASAGGWETLTAALSWFGAAESQKCRVHRGERHINTACCTEPPGEELQ